jgi:phospholipase C
VTYDEHGGFYDHVAPPATIPPGDIVIDKDNNHHNFSFTQLGVRVPAIVISPLIPRNIIDHTIYDHTSHSTVETLFGLKPLTKRDAAAHSLTHLISLNIPRIDAPLTLQHILVSSQKDLIDYLAVNQLLAPKGMMEV